MLNDFKMLLAVNKVEKGSLYMALVIKRFI